MINRREFLKDVIKGSIPLIAGLKFFPTKLYAEDSPSSIIEKAKISLDNAEYQKAIDILEEGLKTFSKDENIKNLLCRSLGLYGDELINNKNYFKAANLLKHAVDLKNDDAWLHGLLGKAYYNLNERRDSFDSFQAALKLNPDDFYSRWMIDILTQTPLPPPKATPVPHSELERLAFAEQDEYLKSLKKIKNAANTSESLKYQINRIVIDPGHGGFDDGAIGPQKIKEKDIVLKIAKQMRTILTEKGKKIFLTRDDDFYLTLAERTALANRYRADLFISLHCNSADSEKATGIESYYCSVVASNEEAERVAKFENKVLKEFDNIAEEKEGELNLEEILFLCARSLYWRESEKYASLIQNKMIEKVMLPNRKYHGANFFVLRKAKMPSILLEMGFISNPKEEKLLLTEGFQKNIAEAIVSAMV